MKPQIVHCLGIGVVALLVTTSCSSNDSATVTETSAVEAAVESSTTMTLSTDPVESSSTDSSVRDHELLDDVMSVWRGRHPEAAGSAFSVVISRPGMEPTAAVSGDGVSLDSWFRVGSVTKTYTATALLRLVEAGRLDLDVPLSTYLDDPIGSPDLTTRSLLTHTSGLPDYLENPGWLESITNDQTREWSTDDILALVDATGTTPGSFAYSNTNYVVAGQVLEAVTGATSREAIEQLVLAPAGLVDTDTSGDSHPVVDAAIDLGDGSVVSTNELDAYTAIETSASTAGFMSSTPTDLAEFGRALLDVELLSADTFAEMTSTSPGEPYGLGLATWSDLGEPRFNGVGNYGEIPGYGAMLLIDPTTGIVLVATGADDRATTDQLALLLQTAVNGGDIGEPIADGSMPVPDVGPVESDPAVATEALFAGIAADGPGCAAAVNQGGEIVFARAWGQANLAEATPITTATVFDVGSLTKQFTASAVLLLVERGDIDLDAPLSTYLSVLPDWSTEVTVDQAMHHTSGIADYIELILADGGDLEAPASTDDAYMALAGTQLEFAPGSTFVYSNSNYLILASIIEAVTGSPFADVIDTLLLEPTGIAGVVDPTGAIDDAAVSHVRDGNDWVAFVSPWSQVGDGGLQTTPVALAEWASQYWNPTVGGSQLATDRFARAVETGEVNTEVYGAGMQLSDIKGIGAVMSHLGGWEAFISTFLVAPEQQVAVVVSCNAVELDPVQNGVGQQLLEIWLPTT